MTLNRNQTIDAIKGMMILVIVIHHSQLTKFLHHGYLAVDVFFWISGVFLMRSFQNSGRTAFEYTCRRIKKVFLPYLLSFLLACFLDYKHLLSFTSFDEFISIYAPFSAFLTLTEELGPPLHSYVILVGGWYLSVLVIGGFLLYSLLEYDKKLATKIILPFGLILGFTFLFHSNSSIENFSKVGVINSPLLRGLLEMSSGALLYSTLKEHSEVFNRHTAGFNILACLSYALFICLLFTNNTLDAFTVITIPAILTGAFIQGSWLENAYNQSKLKLLPKLGEISLEVYLIHSPALHIVHSTCKYMHLSIPTPILVLLDLAFVIIAAILLKIFCNALIQHKASVI